ncbi:minor tail protein [Arthrobacter phage Vibaki]|uniref:Minor tail protein n=1 Tax=Arthrobacter phage Vibaki TaxID=2593333 RepID=A0A514TYX5_9CAUD|nr:minor tail protein [Arthrobacter phage Vibaki]QDK01904.1 minor tail protein [Arthrobacter phage Vibaki]
MSGLSSLRTPARASTGRGAIPSVWRGVIAENYGDGTVAALVPALLGDQAVRMPSIVTGLLQGASILVGAVEGRRDDLVVIAALNADGTIIGPGRFTTIELTNAPTLSSHAVTKGYADALGSVPSTADSIVRRGATGSIIVQDCYLGGAQLAANAATTKAYVDGLIAGRYEKAPIVIPSGADLNAYTTPGFYHQPANAGAAAGSNYPQPLAGLLEVWASGSMVYQRYMYYNSGIIVTRSKYSTTWYGWKELSAVGHTHAYSSLTGLPSSFPSDWSTLTGIPATFTPSAHNHDATEITAGTLPAARLPAATGSVQGAMSAADKAKLDAASATTVANALALRSASGHLSANVFLGDAAQSTATNAMTRKDYVDAQVATRSATGHVHTYADISGTVPTSALPPLAINDTFPVASQAEMLALTAQRGDMAIRSDNGKTYVLSVDAPATLANWKEVLAAGQVQSVAGKTGVVSLVKADVGLGSVDNTTDLLKPISTATQTALNGKAATSHTHAIADVTSLQSTLDGKAASVHTHSAADLTSGTVPVARLPLATTSAAGALSAADKTILDGATSAATASKLVERDASGRAQFADPSVASDAATKGYVDGLAAKHATASAAGKTAFAAVAAGGVSGTVVINFPAGLFDAEPSLAFGSNDPRLSFSATGVSATGFSVRAFNYTTAASGASAACWWTATQP